jgi:peptide/nickel transport system ATP-binding protein
VGKRKRTMPVLEINNLVIDFETDQGVVEAIDHLTLSVREGEILGVVGESGCGKTTVARSIMGVVPQPLARLRDGEIRFQGEELLSLSEADLTARVRGKAVTVIPQDPLASLNPLFPVGVQLRDLLRWSRTSGATGGAKASHGRIIDLLKAVQLPSPETQLRKYPHEFSGGQRQCLLIAAALAPEPSLIIADEPTSALDVTVQAQILLLLKSPVKERGTSVFLITHDLGVVAKLCDRVAVMYAGQEAEVAPTASLFRHPSHPKTARQPTRPATGGNPGDSGRGAEPHRSAPGVSVSYALRGGHAGVPTGTTAPCGALSGSRGALPSVSRDAGGWPCLARDIAVDSALYLP